MVLLAFAADTGCTRHTQIAARGAQVMPFDLEQTIHVFRQLDHGGQQTVTATDSSDTRQIALIRSHLEHEAGRFRRGDFSDPATIHGADMPGLAQLQTAFDQIAVRYVVLPDGAAIQYITADPDLVAALHAWFRAQVSDHGPHAVGR